MVLQPYFVIGSNADFINLCGPLVVGTKALLVLITVSHCHSNYFVSTVWREEPIYTPGVGVVGGADRMGGWGKAGHIRMGWKHLGQVGSVGWAGMGLMYLE